jgi:integrase/recombinase XerD
MLERYFVKPATVDRVRASWIGGPIEQYIGWLSEQGYAARNVFRRVPILVQFGAFAAERGARRLDELPGHIDGFVAEWLRAHGGKSGPEACRKIASAARSPIEQMLRIALPDMPAANRRPHVLQPFIGEAPGFFAYLREERGLREATIDHYSHFLRSFEAYVSRIECPTLGALSGAERLRHRACRNLRPFGDDRPEQLAAGLSALPAPGGRDHWRLSPECRAAPGLSIGRAAALDRLG